MIFYLIKAYIFILDLSFLIFQSTAQLHSLHEHHENPDTEAESSADPLQQLLSVQVMWTHVAAVWAAELGSHTLPRILVITAFTALIRFCFHLFPHAVLHFQSCIRLCLSRSVELLLSGGNIFKYVFAVCSIRFDVGSDASRMTTFDAPQSAIYYSFSRY